MKEKKKVLLILGVLIGVLSVVGISYALWQLNLTQTGTNVVTTGCFQVEFTDQNPISLTNAYPITNDEGKTLTPYEFTITNTCDSEASYQINLEVLNDSTFTELGYIREMLNEKEGTSGSKILSTNSETEKTLENASSAYKLSNGVLAGNESKTFEFRLWIDYDTPAIESVMEKTLNSKITVITSFKEPVDTTNMMVSIEVLHGINNTYIQGDKYRTILKKVIFENVKNPIEGALEIKDFSVNQDESVLGYYVGNESEVELHIQANGKIKMNQNGSYYFTTGYNDYSQKPIYTFEGIEHMDTSDVTNMSSMFLKMDSLTNLDLSSFDTSNVTDMSSMFSGMRNLTSLDISNFDTSKVTDMSSMFEGLGNIISLDLSGFNTSKVTDMSSMFWGMSGLTNLDLRNFDTSKVTNMEVMFSYCSSLTSLDLSHFDTFKVTDMSRMFNEMTNLINLDISGFDTSNVTSMWKMFENSSNLATIKYGSNFIRKSEATILDMYTNCPANKPTHSSWNGVFE